MTDEKTAALKAATLAKLMASTQVWDFMEDAAMWGSMYHMGNRYEQKTVEEIEKELKESKDELVAGMAIKLKEQKVYILHSQALYIELQLKTLEAQLLAVTDKASESAKASVEGELFLISITARIERETKTLSEYKAEMDAIMKEVTESELAKLDAKAKAEIEAIQADEREEAAAKAAVKAAKEAADNALALNKEDDDGSS